MRVLVADHVEIDRLALGPGFEVDYRPGVPRDELLRLLPSYEAVVVRSRTKVDREVIDAAPKLRLVARSGTGLDNVDVDYAKTKGVTVINSPEALVEAVAEHVTLLVLALSRKLVQADASTRAGGWAKEEFTGVELKGKTLGIVGMGRIGRRIGEIAKVLGMDLVVYDVIPVPSDVVERLGCRVSDLQGVFSDGDYVTLHVPLTDGTRHMVDSGVLAKMKRTAFIVNTSRGGVIDERALIDALREGRVAGAALDVFENEPPSGPILSAPNLILTPHIGGQTAEAQAAAISVVGEKIRSFFLPQ